MSDVPPNAEPDLHEIFGLEDDGRGSPEPAIAVERRDGGTEAEPRVEIERAGADDGDAPRVDVERLLAEEIGEQEAQTPAGAAAPEAGGPQGITRPSRRGAAQGFLTDVIVNMGLASRQQVDDAVESSRATGTTP